MNERVVFLEFADVCWRKEKVIGAATRRKLIRARATTGSLDVDLVCSFDGGATGNGQWPKRLGLIGVSPEITKSSQSRGVLVGSGRRRVWLESREIDGDGDDVWQGGEVWLREGMRLEGMEGTCRPLSSWAVV